MDSCQDAILKIFLQSIDGERLFVEDLEDAEAYQDTFLELPTKIGIADEDKMQYLLQPMEQESKAERFVLNSPATAANYYKAIDQLKKDLDGKNY
ncbi:hypothetical protein TNIN_417441 [Trichonephila inaurata madagascariensis]|uniref:Uncharacterized protein n=1 Tax=Trichonephila inaurata madagascariensis TaxID=2747483 RepID=A0A8X6YNV1_9ARAC|nr:hypothetical protein TNIN_417441 [Trichonephila inaurata madagascariensis]